MLPDGFLDLKGLKRYTTKILKAIQDSVITYIAGDGVNLQDNTISVANPMRGVMTQAEFDALPDNEKNTGTYIIEDAVVPASTTAFEVYDDQERLIGSWFGKPLYRRVVHSTMPSSSTPQSVYQLPDDCGEVVSLFGYAHSDELNMNQQIGANSSSMYQMDNTIGVYNSYSALYSAPLTFIMEYTKNTDS